jgi:KUP system potassium uptake protein
MVPVSLVVLTALFAVQRFGTGGIGKFFGPVTVLWFVVLAVLGVLAHPQRQPAVLVALSPHHALASCATRTSPSLRWARWCCASPGRGAVRRPGPLRQAAHPPGLVRLVMPALVLNYFGQGAMLLAHPENIKPTPSTRWRRTGRCSRWSGWPPRGHGDRLAGADHGGVLGHQAGHPAGLPAAPAHAHTSVRETGQIYVPFVNWALYGCIVLAVALFGSSSALASAYGIAVTIDMTITTVMTFFVIRFGWKLPCCRLCLLATGFFFVIDITFFAANAVKVLDGWLVPAADRRGDVHC